MSPNTSSSTNIGAAEGAHLDLEKQLDELLSKQLLQMSLNDRNNIQEEIHGVRCLAPEETAEFLEDSLSKLAVELKDIPDLQKQAYLQSQQRPASKAFVNDRDFRLRFLRCELFNYRKAAERMVRVCDALLKFFGSYALERSVKLSDFTNAELKIFRKGRLQILPFRDRSGRRIASLFPGLECLKEKDCDRQKVRALQIKLAMYVSYILGSDVDTQRRGAVFLIWFDSMLESTAYSDVLRIKEGEKSHQLCFLRAGAVHLCSPDTPFSRLQLSILSLGVGSNLSKFRIHVGEPIELRYQLNSYGISTETIPLSWTGTVKVNYLKQWLRIRQYLEDPSFYEPKLIRSKFCDKTCSSNKNNGVQPCTCRYSQPIECPGLNDIVFKKGKSAKSHPGNAHFRSLIQLKYEHEHERFKSKIDCDHQARYIKPYSTDIVQSLVEHFFGEVQKGNMRVLMWNEKYSWWSILNDDRVVRKKIEKTVISSCENSHQCPPSSPQEDEEVIKQPFDFFVGPSDLKERNQSLQAVTSICESLGGNGNKRRKTSIYDVEEPNARECFSARYF